MKPFRLTPPPNLRIINHALRAKLAEHLMLARRDSGLNQGKLARLAGVSPFSLCRVEAGTKMPTPMMCLRVDSVLGTNLALLRMAHLSVPIPRDLPSALALALTSISEAGSLAA